MINTLVLGQKNFPVNLIQGPLAGVSCAPFRRLTWRYSKPAYSCTEMISCKTLINKPLSYQQRFIKKDPHEGPVCFQLSAHDPRDLAQATKMVTDYGADLIDLNCGCPVKKIRSKNAGSSLLTNPTLLYTLIRAMKDNTHLPVSIKIRVQGNDDQFNQTLVHVIKDAGVDFLVVHGRHWTENYDVACRYDQIKFFVASLKIPVIGNGDIANEQTLKNMFNTGCAGYMIARAGVGQPWLIEKLIKESQGLPYQLPNHHEIGEIFIEHIAALASLLNSDKLALLQARKLAKYYARSLTSKLDFCNAINTCDGLSHFSQLVLTYFNAE